MNVCMKPEEKVSLFITLKHTDIGYNID